MKRTQIQLPDRLFAEAKDVAERKEISLAELVRRGLEYMVAVTPGTEPDPRPWEPPSPHPLESQDPFTSPDWREQIHTERLQVAENPGSYDSGSRP